MKWRSVYKLMEQGAGLGGVVESDVDIQETYNEGTTLLQSRASYIWKTKKKYAGWKVTNWAKHLRRKAIFSAGDADDLENLPSLTIFNTRVQKRTREGSS